MGLSIAAQSVSRMVGGSQYFCTVCEQNGGVSQYFCTVCERGVELSIAA